MSPPATDGPFRYDPPDPSSDLGPLKAVPVPHYGRVVSAVVVLAAAVWLVLAFADAKIDWGMTGEYLFDPEILRGAGNTLLISVAAMALGIALGVLAAVMRLSGDPVASAVASGYIWVFRGTPVLVQLLLWWNLALIFPTMFGTSTNDLITPFVAALLGLGINEGAYMAEIVRAGIVSVDAGQTEAAQALGMSRAKTMRRIVLPQAMRVIVPPTGNEYVNMLKTSSLAILVTYPELMLKVQNVYTTNLAVMELLFVACFWYLVLTTVFSVGQYHLERYFGRGSRQGPATGTWWRVWLRTVSFRRPARTAPSARTGADGRGNDDAG